VTGSTFKLAVIINCYNYADYVERAIRSVLAQGREDCELIVVDDGSVDASWEVINRTGVKAYRIENSRQRKACLYGLEKTSAPFVLFLDADDELLPGALETIIPQLEASVAKLQFCLCRIDGDNNPLHSVVPQPATVKALGDLRERVLKTGVYASPPTSGNVFRRDVCELLRDADYDDAVDGVIILAAPFFGDVIALSAELGLYRVHSRNMSGVGREIDPDQIESDMNRFKNRLEHLNVILARRSESAELDCERTFFYAEKKFILSVIKKNGGKYRNYMKLASLTHNEYFTPSQKYILLLFYTAAAVIPNDWAKFLINIRYRPERRNIAAMAKALIAHT
jgi:glycosyltransferase involved in cell wall biosynthesis